MYLSFPCLPDLRIYASNSKCYATVVCHAVSNVMSITHDDNSQLPHKTLILKKE